MTADCGGSLLLQPLGADGETWKNALAEILPDVPVRIWPDVGDPAAIGFAAIQVLPTGELGAFPNLRLICSLFAGQEVLLSDPGLPDVPIVRTDGGSGNQSMNESVVMHVLRHYRRLPDYASQQAAREWRRLPQHPREETCVTILGLGLLGLGAARAVRAFGFRVAGWTRTPRSEPGIETFHGLNGLDAILRQTHILVNLLPLTPATQGILNRDRLGRLPRDSALINLARGSHLQPEDLYWALDQGILSSATLDVFDPEPPPPDARVWHDPRITLTPHVARADFAFREVVATIADAIVAVRSGRQPDRLVERAVGY